jgi:hypothetical protein
MPDHASYKYLVHLDGQSCSSRLEQLLVMGSVVLKVCVCVCVRVPPQWFSRLLKRTGVYMCFFRMP